MLLCSMYGGNASQTFSRSSFHVPSSLQAIFHPRKVVGGANFQPTKRQPSSPPARERLPTQARMFFHIYHKYSTECCSNALFNSKVLLTAGARLGLVGLSQYWKRQAPPKSFPLPNIKRSSRSRPRYVLFFQKEGRFQVPGGTTYYRRMEQDGEPSFGCPRPRRRKPMAPSPKKSGSIGEQSFILAMTSVKPVSLLH